MSAVLGGGLVTGLALPGAAGATMHPAAGRATVHPQSTTPASPSSGCVISGPTGNIKHVIEVIFDNVHYNRDNPDVLSDMEQIPALLNFIENNGVLLSNQHTPLIAHTADDTLTNYTGLYGDRQGQGVSNDYYQFTGGGSTVSAQQANFAFWNALSTVPGDTDASGATYPKMDYSATVPPTDPDVTYTTPQTTPGGTSQTSGPSEVPAPWVPYTEGGCDVGAVSTSNMELENLNPDIKNVFGSSSPEEAQLTADTSHYQDTEANDYEGLAIHCAANDPLCSNAQAAKYNQTSASYDAVADDLPTEPAPNSPYEGTSPTGNTPGSGFLGLFGHKYLQPVLDGAANATEAQAEASGCELIGSVPGSPGSFVTGATYRIVANADISAADPASEHCYEVADAGTNSNAVSDGSSAAQAAAAADNGQNLVDLFGQEMDGEYSDASGAGFPGFGPITAAQSLAYTADMQEVGVPVTYSYISDVHEVAGFDTVQCSPGSYYDGSADDNADGPGDPCYYQTTQYYNQAFLDFLQRLADDGITKANTLFVFGDDEDDHFSGANVGRAETPSCTGPSAPDTWDTSEKTPTNDTNVCTYADNQIGEVEVDIHGLLKAEDSDSTAFTSQPQGEALYVPGDPGVPGQIAANASTRQLEQDFGNLTIDDPFDGPNAEPVTKWEVDAEGEALLHFDNADQARTPTFTEWPNPDIYFTSGSSDSCGSGTTAANAASKCGFIDNEYAWNHGYYAPEVNNNWAALVGPGVQNIGVDGNQPWQGPSSAGSAESLTTDIQLQNSGVWLDQTDIRPTLMYLTGLKDSYTEDGRVLAPVLDPDVLNSAVSDPNFEPLAECYKQLNSSVGEFGTDVITASTPVLESATNTAQYQSFETQLDALGTQRDQLASELKQALWNAEFDDTPIPNAAEELGQCNGVLAAADNLAGLNPPKYVPESPATAALPVLAVAMLALGSGFVIYRRRRHVAATRN